MIPCHATGEQLRRPVSPTRAAARKAEEARETAPPLVLALREAVKGDPDVILVDLPDACLQKGLLRELLEPLEPLLRARHDSVRVATAREGGVVVVDLGAGRGACGGPTVAASGVPVHRSTCSSWSTTD